MSFEPLLIETIAQEQHGILAAVSLGFGRVGNGTSTDNA
jgi:hypothetical protein